MLGLAWGQCLKNDKWSVGCDCERNGKLCALKLTSVLEEEPVVALIVISAALGKRELVLRVVTLSQILQDAASLKDPDRLAVVESVHDGRNAPIGVDLKIPRFFLAKSADVNVLYFVREPELLECGGDLDSVGSRVCVQLDVRLRRHGGITAVDRKSGIKRRTLVNRVAAK